MRFQRTLGAAMIGLLSAGCVTQEKYNAVRLERDGLNEQLARAQQDNAMKEAKVASWKTQIDQLMAGNGSQGALTKNLYEQNADLQKQLADATAKYNDALARIGQGAPLPANLSNAIADLADQNPTLITFDAKTGTVKFTSDLTFNSGDAALQPQATNVINQFATILNSPAARGYELLVCGHADNQKVSAGTMSRGHKDNWYLSSHRALSVAEQLQKDGVNSKRIGAVGYGEYRPVASNDTKAGMAMNRRVEVMILPQQIADSTPIPSAPVNANVGSERPKIEVKTDTAADNTMNK